MKKAITILAFATLLTGFAPAQESTGGSDESRLLAIIDSNPKNEDAYNQLLKLYSYQGRRKERLKIALKAIQNLGGNTYLFMIVGDENKLLGEYNKSLVAYQFALKVEPNNAEIYNRMGLTLLKMNAFNQAESAFKAAVFFSESSDDTAVKSVYYNNLACCYDEQGMVDLKTAMKYFQIAVRYNPGYELAQANLRRVKDLLRKQGVSVD